MTEQAKILYEQSRMCRTVKECGKCPIENLCYDNCDTEAKANQAASLILAWAARHPEKTYAEDFFEKFPNADRYDKNCLPKICVRSPYGLDAVKCLGRCIDCWNQPMRDKP
mgnify:CR=1 FL=1